MSLYKLKLNHISSHENCIICNQDISEVVICSKIMFTIDTHLNLIGYCYLAIQEISLSRVYEYKSLTL